MIDAMGRDIAPGVAPVAGEEGDILGDKDKSPPPVRVDPSFLGVGEDPLLPEGNGPGDDSQSLTWRR